jgi:hypothetical protein
VTHAQLWYRSVADVLVVRWGDEEVLTELEGPGAIAPLFRADGSCGGVRIRDFSSAWPTANRQQIASLTSHALVSIIDARFASLEPAPSCLGLNGAELERALADGFDDELDVA